MMRAPFRAFFVAASMDAIVGAAVWLAPVFDPLHFPQFLATAGNWHRNALLFGTIPAILAGFLLTALPRWTGSEGPSMRTVRVLFVLWLCGRGIFIALSPAAGLLAAALFCASLFMIVARAVISNRDRRNIKLLLPLGAFTASVVLTAFSWHATLALRMGLASIVGLLMIVGGRVVPALTAAYGELSGRRGNIAYSAFVEWSAALVATCALVAWIASPDALITGLLCLLAAFWQSVRLAQWRGWHSRDSSVIALHAGYGWIVVGFILVAIGIFLPGNPIRSDAIHAWTIGAIGTMALAIMASMTRRHSGLALTRSTAMAAAYAMITGACLARLAIGLSRQHAALGAFSATLWIAAFLLFLTAFRSPLFSPR